MSFDNRDGAVCLFWVQIHLYSSNQITLNVIHVFSLLLAHLIVVDIYSEVSVGRSLNDFGFTNLSGSGSGY